MILAATLFHVDKESLCIYDCYFWVQFPVFAVKYFSKLKFCIHDCHFWVRFPVFTVKYFSKLKFCIYDCTVGLDFSFLLLSISQNWNSAFTIVLGMDVRMRMEWTVIVVGLTQSLRMNMWWGCMNMTQSSKARKSWNISHRVVTTLLNQKVTVRKKTLTMYVGRAQEKSWLYFTNIHSSSHNTISD